MELYLYKTGTHTPLLTVKNVQGYTADRITALDPEGNSVTYSPLGEDCELSARADCTETLRADWRETHPDEKTRIAELEALMAALLYGGEDE